MSQTSPLAVRVPASTSNLGPGFDLLGLALALYVDVELAPRSTGEPFELIETLGEAREWPRNGNLFTTALVRGAERFGAHLPPLELRVRSNVPLERGLGSSGAAVVAGLVLARALAQNEREDRELLDLAFELEGHPDNVTPALLGGCTLSLPTPRGIVAIRQAVHASIRIAVAWPDARLSTREARAALPKHVQFSDAVENPRRLACLLEGLRTGDATLLELGGEDRLHVQHRLPLIPGAARALDAARDAGAWLATLSGSGTALIALGPEAHIRAIVEALRDGLATAQDAVHAQEIALEPRGAYVVRGTLKALEP